MLISIDWIKDFVEVPNITPKELGSRFTLSTAEVEDVISVGEHFGKIRVAEIVNIEPHPDADKLRLVTFNFGEEKNKRVVCGASNVRVGLKTPYAPLGITLPNGLTLEPKKIRGVLSEGMLCSEEELGYAEKSSGIMELAEDAQVGMSIAEYFNEKQDILLDVDNKSLTHRPDLWGHYGLAREFAAIFETELKNPFDEDWQNTLLAKVPGGYSPVKVEFQGESAGIGYFGLSVDNVKVGESPNWLKRRLNAVGLRPINNIVDISNYVMTELGIPLHIFDREEIKGDKVIIKQLNQNEKFVTLDEIERELVPGDTVIADSERSLVIGGLMGGLNSGVTEKTTKVFIEVANWQAAKVRKTSTRLGLRTDSSQRYEKTLDTQLLKRTLLRTLEMLLEFCPEASVIGEIEYDGIDLNDNKPLQITTSVNRIIQHLGKEINKQKIVSILESLDFNVRDEGDESLFIEVPSYRSTKDIECEADIFEEVGRIIGYDNIDPESPQVCVSPVRLSPAQKMHRSLRNFLSLNVGAYELMTYPMVGEKLLRKADWPSNVDLKIINSLSVDHSQMRNSLVPGFLQVASENAKNFDQFKFFELGRTYHKDAKAFSREDSILGIAFYDREENCFMDLVNSVEKIISAHNLPADLCEKHPKFKNELVDEQWSGVHPFEFYNIRLMGKMKGAVLSVHPIVLRSFKIKGHLSFAFLDLSTVEKQPAKDKTKYKSLPKFPGSSFDWTVVAASAEPVESILTATKKAKIKEMDSCKVVDVYKLNENEKTVTLRAHFSDPEKTLSGEFLASSQEKLVKVLDEAGYPLKS